MSCYPQVWAPFIWLYSMDTDIWPECCWMQVLILTRWSVPVLHWLTSLYTTAYNILHLKSLSLLYALFVTQDVKSGHSPLIHAVESGNADMVHFLTEVTRMSGHWGKTCDSALLNIYVFFVQVICCIFTDMLKCISAIMYFLSSLHSILLFISLYTCIIFITFQTERTPFWLSF